MWLGVDPLAEKYPDVSPYVYCHGNPVVRIDPDGKADFYSRIGDYLGNDGCENGEIYLMNEGVRPKTENKNINWGGELESWAVNQLCDASEQVDGLIVQNRIEEGKDYTISEFCTIGNNANTEGCNMPGKTKGTGSIGDSRNALKELKTFISSQKGSNVKTIINNNIE